MDPFCVHWRREGGEVAHPFFAMAGVPIPLTVGAAPLGFWRPPLPPNNFVLRTPAERDEIVVHAMLFCFDFLPGKSRRPNQRTSLA